MAQHLKNATPVTNYMIPEVVIKRKLPKYKVHLSLLRLLSVRGKGPESEGKNKLRGVRKKTKELTTQTQGKKNKVRSKESVKERESLCKTIPTENPKSKELRR